MLEIFLIISVIFLILTFFYKQAICEFRINQIEWSQNKNIQPLLQEKIPLVIRDIPSATFWTIDDVNTRSIYSNIPIFQDSSLIQWINNSSNNLLCPWKYQQAEQIAKVSSISVWASKWLNPLIINPFMKLWINPSYYCWSGNVGLQKTYATWNCIFPVDGEIIVSIMPENLESFLPANWVGCIPSELTNRDTPFINDVKFIDIILRPGNCLFMPAHWFWSWKSHGSSEIIPMTCTIAYHTPISYIAWKMTPYK